jgi:FKBP-type peptidyl-prolyl cis-trans isomerase
MKIITCAALAALLAACSTEGVKTDKKPVRSKKETTDNRLTAEKLLEPKKTIVSKKEFPNGIRIQWFEQGNGATLEDGKVYEINYKVKLMNGEVIDGNHLLARDMLPFLVGYGMQGTGWDLAMKELHTGDFAEVYLPANLSRGKKGIDGVVPPNSPNIIFLRIGKEIKPTRTVDGTKVWLLEEQSDNTHVIHKQSAVALHYFVGSKSNPRYDNSYQRNAPFRFHMDDHGLVPGLRKALLKAKLYDKLWIVVPADQAYGSKGYLDLVAPNESMFYDVFVNEVDGQV